MKPVDNCPVQVARTERQDRSELGRKAHKVWGLESISVVRWIYSNRGLYLHHPHKKKANGTGQRTPPHPDYLGAFNYADGRKKRTERQIGQGNINPEPAMHWLYIKLRPCTSCRCSPFFIFKPNCACLKKPNKVCPSLIPNNGGGGRSYRHFFSDSLSLTNWKCARRLDKKRSGAVNIWQSSTSCRLLRLELALNR